VSPSNFKETEEGVCGGFNFLDDISTNRKHLDKRCIFNFELSLINFFSSTEVEKSVLYIFCNNIFLKKVTLEKPYGVSGVVDGENLFHLAISVFVLYF
jgi:hypothetical protein